MKAYDLKTPGAIEIMPPESQAGEDGFLMPTVTGLFRKGSYLSLDLGLVRERIGGEVPKGFVSVGCSDGSELDSWLALCNRENPDRGLMATGIDVNPWAVEAAQKGVHTMRSTFFAPLVPPYQEGVLEEMGFDVSRLPVSVLHSAFAVPAFRLQADAGPVRKGHDVRFVQHDASEPLPVKGTADVVMANNVLFGNRIMAAVRNMASVLSDRGILSFGGNTLTPGSPPTRREIVHLLDEEFDLKSLYSDSIGTPVVFGRD